MKTILVLSAAAFMGALGGCVSPCVLDEFDEELSSGHLVLRIGHRQSPENEQVMWEDGTRERVWSRTAEESAARAVILFVKDADEVALDAGEFREVSRTPPHSGLGKRVVLERDRTLDPHRRSFRVTLWEKGGFWIPEAIVVCQQDVPGEEF